MSVFIIRLISLFLIFSTITSPVFSQIIITGNSTICAGESTTLTAEMTGSGYGTTNYVFEIINFDDHPPFEDGTAIDPDFTGCTTGGHDDCFAPPNGTALINGFPIGFTFCFFNQQYDRFWVGSNGWIGFSNPTGKTWTTYTATAIPNPARDVPKNCIFAPWQDWYPGAAGGGNNVYYYNEGIAPNRKLVVYWLNCPLYNCQNNPEKQGTFMIVLNEQSSVIENFIQNKPQCNGSDEGATQGVHNIDGTIAYTAHDDVTGIDRNYTVWTAENEGTRFNPSGVNWYKDAMPPEGTLVGYGDNLEVSPATTTTYFAVAGTCDGNLISSSITVTVNSRPSPIIDGATNVCQNDIKTYNTDITGNNFTWTYSGATLMGGGTLNDNWITLKWTNAGSNSVSVNYKNSFGCNAVTPATLEITVGAYESPIINTPTVENCAASSVVFTTQIGKSNYVWEYITSGATLISGGSNIDHTITLKWTSQGIKTISVTYTENGCTGDPPVEKEITIKPLPNVNPPSTSGICSGTNTNITLTSTPPGSVFSWNSPDPTCTNVAPCPGGKVNATEIADIFTLINPNLSGNVKYFITPSLNNCSGPMQMVSLYVYPLPGTAGAILGPTAVCPNSMQKIYSIPLIANTTNYLWNYSGIGGIITNNGNSIFIDFLPNATSGNLTVKGLNSCGEGSPATLGITINPMPGPSGEISSANGSTVCPRQNGVSYSINPIENASDYHWTYSGSGMTPFTNGPNQMIDFSSTATHGVLTVYGQNSCGVGAVSTPFTINVKPKPTVEFPVCNAIKTTKNGKPILLKGGRPLGNRGVYSGTGVIEISPGSYVFDPARSEVIGGSPTLGNDYPITYRYTNIEDCFDEQSVTISVFASNASTPCPGTVKDYRDDQIYPTFLVGTGANAQCWMAANLNRGIYTNQNTLQSDNCIFEKYCKDNVEAHCAQSGGYYQWDEIMEYQEISTYQNLCPPGWHLPSAAEWDDLIMAFEGNAIAGGYLKDPNIQDGFNGLLEGIFYQNNRWSFGSDPFTATMYWTSESLNHSTAVARGLNNFNYSVSYYPAFKANAFPVRCVRD